MGLEFRPMKHYLKNILWLAAKQVLRDNIYSLAQFLLSLVFSISFFIKLNYFIFPEVSQEIQLKLSSDVLSITLNILMLLSVILYILVTLLYNKHRHKSFGIMRGVGARKAFIFFLIFFENTIVMISATIAAVLLSSFFFNPSANYLERMYSVTVAAGWEVFLKSSGFVLSANIVVSMISAFLPSVKILFTDPYEILRSRE
jgi:ABC-type antimicrobial peptide transport system permease subunit